MPTPSRGSAAYNAVLRRADWRFLLSGDMLRVTIRSSDTTLSDAVALFAHESGAQIGVETQSDLVIATDPGASSLKSARAMLRRGGWLYTEWHSSFVGVQRRARNALSSAGFTDVALYEPWPSVKASRFWLPVDDPGALRHFWSMQRGGGTRLRQLGRLVRELIWRLRWQTGLIVPVCAVGRTAPARTTESPPQRGLLDIVRDGWPDWGLDGVPGRLSCLMLTGGTQSISKCVALIFQEPCYRPRLVVKLPRVPDSIPALAREAAVLERLHSRHPGVLAGLPRVIFCGEKSGRMLLLETALSGTPLEKVVRRGNFRALAFRVTDWLADFAQHTVRHWTYDWLERIAEPVIDEFALSFHELADRSLLHRTRDTLATIGPLPIMPEHRDFSPWNILLDSQETLNVLDWESATLEGLPALDLIYFLTYLAFKLDDVPIDTTSQRLRRAYRRTLDPATFTGSVRKACLDCYSARLGLDSDRLHRLAPLVWLIHSRSDYGRFAADAGEAPDQDALQRSVFLSLWEEEMNTAPYAALPAAPKRRASVRLA